MNRLLKFYVTWRFCLDESGYLGFVHFQNAECKQLPRLLLAGLKADYFNKNLEVLMDNVDLRRFIL
ncbi:hypothetical protein [Aliiglaciecola sp. M165]|uniref:hypothetical protein n=1 Tax=Aliiglaciecola sp. M165 TaxID=2593649 RepID=UPI00117BDFD3|nr:hypothetical protein [Aliiglaciecola sp. M165]